MKLRQDIRANYHFEQFCNLKTRVAWIENNMDQTNFTKSS
jgi:hypothetical protein